MKVLILMESTKLVEILTQKKLTLGSSESITGGGFANFVTNIPGASLVFKGGFVTYSNEMKMKLLHVSNSTLDQYGAISKQCVKEMVENTKKILAVDIAVAFSGNGGPTTSENKPVGLIYIGVAYQDKVIVDEVWINKSRLEIKKDSIDYAINLIYSLIGVK